MWPFIKWLITLSSFHCSIYGYQKQSWFDPAGLDSAYVVYCKILRIYNNGNAITANLLKLNLLNHLGYTKAQIFLQCKNYQPFSNFNEVIAKWKNRLWQYAFSGKKFVSENPKMFLQLTVSLPSGVNFTNILQAGF